MRNRNSRGEKKSAKSIVRLNYSVALFAQFFKNPVGRISVAMASAMFSAVGILVFVLAVVGKRQQMDDVPVWITLTIGIVFAIAIALGSLISEINRRKYKLTPEQLRKLKFFDFDKAAIVGNVLFITDIVLSVSGWSNVFDLSSLSFNLDEVAMLTGVITLAVAPPIVTKFYGSLYAESINGDQTYDLIEKAINDMLREFVRNGGKFITRRDNDEDEQPVRNSPPPRQRENVNSFSEYL
jgi:hypothetical protein